MKRFICLLLAFVSVASCACADSSTIYKSDKFFLYLDGEWKQGLQLEGATGYYFENKKIIIMEEPVEGGTKAYITFLGRLAYEGFGYTLLKDADYLSYDLTEKDGRYIPVIIAEQGEEGNTYLVACSFVLGDEAAMIVSYYEKGADYKTMKSRIIEIMENASAR